MVDKVNGKAAEGEFLGKQLDFYSVAFTADLNVAVSYAAFVAASGVLTFTGQPSNGDTVVIGARTYTFQTALTNIAGNVLIGGTVAASITNLMNAINAGTGSGTTYAALTTVHPTVSATSNATTLTATAKTAGAAGNTTATTETSATASWGAATLAGGSGVHATEDARAAAAKVRRERIIETISLNGQPIIIGAYSNSTSGSQTLKFAIEHSGSWQDSETLLAADKANTSLDSALEAVPGVTSVTVTKTRAI